MSTREVKKIEAGKEYQVDLLSKETKHLKRNIEKQIGLLENLRSTGNTEKLIHRLEKLNNTFAELNSVSERLSHMLAEDDAKELRRSVAMEGEKVGITVESMNEWLGLRKSSVSREGGNGANSLMTLGNLEGTREAADNAELAKIGYKDVHYSMMQKEGEMFNTHGRASIRSEPTRRSKPPKMVSYSYPEGTQDDGGWERESGKHARDGNDNRSLRSGKSNMSTYSNREQISSEHAAHKFEKELKATLADFRARTKFEIDSIRRLISEGCLSKLSEKINILGELHEKKEATVLALYKILDVDGATRLAEKEAIEDQQIAEVRELVQKVKEYNLTDIRSGVSIRSGRSARSMGSRDTKERNDVEALVRKRMFQQEERVQRAKSKRSAWSGCSSRDSVLEFSGELSKSNQRYALGTNGAEGPTKNLREMFYRFKEELKEQKDVCIELLQSSRSVVSGGQIEKLNEAFNSVADTASRLREQLPSIEADEIKTQVDIEDEEVFVVKKQLIQIMANRSGDQAKKQASCKSTIRHKTTISDDEAEEGKVAGKKNRVNLEMSTIR